MTSHCWAILTGEYPPIVGGVADYTAAIAGALAAAGDEVHIWAPAPCHDESMVNVHSLPDHFSMASLVEIQLGLHRLPKSHRLLIQYVPHAFGWKGLNVPFCLWASSRKDIWLMFHEVASLQGIWKYVNPFMARCLVRAAERIFVSTPAWEDALRKHTGLRKPVKCLPVFSNLPTSVDKEQVERLRKGLYHESVCTIFGYFGSCPENIQTELLQVLSALLENDAKRITVLIGSGCSKLAGRLKARNPSWGPRIICPGFLRAELAALYLSACDVLLYPFPDGVTGRRTSLLSGLGLGLPIVTTGGSLTEPFWYDSGAVLLVEPTSLASMVTAAEMLGRDVTKRNDITERAKSFYREHFSLERTIEVLRA